MNKDLFWNIIDTVNQTYSDKDQESRRCLVVEKLVKLSLEDILDWHLILMEYSGAAYRGYLWAASAALGAHYTDDGFTYFRSWLISRGKAVYMNAMRDPDSLAKVPMSKGEALNFERFGYAAYEAYDAKLLRIDPGSQKTLFDALESRTLDPQVLESIQAELPQRQDIGPDWREWMLPELFPAICKAREATDIEGLLKMGNCVYGYARRKGGRYTQYVFQYTPENIAHFIGAHMDASEITVTDTMDRLILNTVGRFIDRCPDQVLLERVKKVLIPIQMGRAEAPPFFCPTRDEVDAYRARKDFIG